jgi:predicted DNA-binding protein
MVLGYLLHCEVVVILVHHLFNYGLNMATDKRRITISLPKDVDDALAEFSEVTGQAQSAFVVSCLVENVESLKLITQAIKEAKSGNVNGYQNLMAQALGTTLLKMNGSSDSEE